MHKGLLVLLLALTAWPAAAQEKPFKKRVNDAIDKGVAHLKREQDAKGAWNERGGMKGGGTALSLLALCKSGLHSDDPVIKKGFAHLKTIPFKKTYVVAVTVLAIEAAFCHKRKEKFYTRTLVSGNPQLKWMADAVKWLVSKYQQELKGWRYPDSGVDNSHIQYVLLALKAACRCGLSRLIPNHIWRDVLGGLLQRQEKTGPLVKLLGHKKRKKSKRGSSDLKPFYGSRGRTRARGWAYDPQVQGDPATGSMTTAGVASVLLCQSELMRRRDRKYTKRMHYAARSAIESGLAWLAHNWSVEKNPKHPQGEWHYYYLFGIERTGVFLELEKIGTHDWYREGADVLLKKVRDNAWGDHEKTSYALLFLKRASVPPISGK